MTIHRLTVDRLLLSFLGDWRGFAWYNSPAIRRIARLESGKVVRRIPRQRCVFVLWWIAGKYQRIPGGGLTRHFSKSTFTNRPKSGEESTGYKMDLQLFNFEKHPVRTIADENGNPWFVAKDVCEAIGLSNTSQAVERLEEDEKGIYPIDTPGGTQEMLFASESGLYEIVLGSRTTERTKRFKRWVKRDVLPSIRKTGSYLAPQSPEELLHHATGQLVAHKKRLDALEQARMEELTARAQTESRVKELTAQLASQKIDADQKRILRGLLGKLGDRYKQCGHPKPYAAANREFNKHFGLGGYDGLLQSRFDEAISWVQAETDKTRPLPMKLTAVREVRR